MDWIKIGPKVIKILKTWEINQKQIPQKSTGKFLNYLYDHWKIFLTISGPSRCIPCLHHFCFCLFVIKHKKMQYQPCQIFRKKLFKTLRHYSSWSLKTCVLTNYHSSLFGSIKILYTVQHFSFEKNILKHVKKRYWVDI